MIAMSLLLAVLGSGPGDGNEPKALFRPEMFETLVNPACSHCIDESRRKAGVLRDDDRVLSWIRGKYDGGAIPYRWFLVPYRVISDTYGVFVYDADADFVRGYPASLDYRFHGWRNGVMVMRHKDGTLFDCLTGLAFDGPRKGEQLTPIPTIESDWGPWLKANPGTVAYAMVSKFQPQSAPEVPAPGVAKDPPRAGPATRRGGAGFRPGPRRGERSLAAEVVRRAARAAERDARRQEGRHPLGRPDADGGGLRARDGGRHGRAGDARRGRERPRVPVGGQGDGLAMVHRRAGGLRPSQGANAPLAAGRDGQVVRLGGRVSQDDRVP